MNDLGMRRLTAGFGLAIVALNWAMFPLYIVPGPLPQFQDTASYIAYWTSNSGLISASGRSPHGCQLMEAEKKGDMHGENLSRHFRHTF